MEAVRKYLKAMGYSLISKDFYDRIDTWLSWYSGKIPSFHQYNQFNGKKTVKRSRYSLGMSKRVCEDWADLLLNEKMMTNVYDVNFKEIMTIHYQFSVLIYNIQNVIYPKKINSR